MQFASTYHGMRKLVPSMVGFVAFGGILYYVLRNTQAVVVVLSGTGFFYFAWIVISRRFHDYPAALRRSCGAPWGESQGDTFKSVPRIVWVIMIVLSLLLVISLGWLAFQGTMDRRMIWAFHEDEGWLADLYDIYVSQKSMDLGGGRDLSRNWGYTYGSFHLILVSLVGRFIHPFVDIGGASCIILGRLFLLLALLGTGWVVFYTSVRYLKQPALGVLAAALLWTNVKVAEMSLLANYPDTFGMLFATCAFLFIVRVVTEMTPKDIFLAPLFLGLMFSVKYGGLPLALVLLLAFWLSQRLVSGELRRNDPAKSLRGDLFIYACYTGLAFPVMFFTVNPYYAIHFKRFLSQMKIVLSLYSSANIDNLPASAINLPTLADWWRIVGSGGTPEHLILMGFAACIVMGGLTFLLRRKAWSQREVVVGLGFACTVAWSIFVFLNTKFCFFHYLMPVVPIVYLVATAMPSYLGDLLPSHPSRLRTVVFSVIISIFAAALIVPLLLDVLPWHDVRNAYVKNAMGYATRDSTLSSRFALCFQLLRSTRNTDTDAFRVGDWLQKNCKEARTLITNETIFYYPPFIKDIRYWNRNMSFDLLLKTMPDLLMVSDWFVKRYTRDYSRSEIDGMSPNDRAEFLNARQFYMMLHDRESFLNYRKIKVFEAGVSQYWERLHIFSRSGPRSLAGLVKEVSGSPLFKSPNASDILFFDGLLPPSEMYLSVLPNSPLPNTVDIVFTKPIACKGVGYVWWSPQDHPKAGCVEGWNGPKKVFEKPISIANRDCLPYTWIPMNLDERCVDRLVLKVWEFEGQQRLILRRLFLG